MWDIFRHSYCHCSVWNACCCTLVGAGQVAHRLQLTYLGHYHSNNKKSTLQSAFVTLLAIYLSFWCTRIILFTAIALVDPNVHSTEWIDPPPIYRILCALDDLLAYVYFIFSVIVLRNLRSHMRKMYAIPESGQCPTGWEDTCCSILCPCLVTGQMLRHTAEYETYSGRCCSETGLSEAAPEVV